MHFACQGNVNKITCFLQNTSSEPNSCQTLTVTFDKY